MNGNVFTPSSIFTSTPLPTSTDTTTSRKRPSLIIDPVRKKSRKSRRVYDFKFEFLAQFFHMPQKQAAKALNVSVITIKRNCKRYGFRWPYRASKYIAGKKFVLSERGRAFHDLPLDCLRAETDVREPQTYLLEESECNTDTESVEEDERAKKKDFCQILFSLHKIPICS
ncbi:hypothetical protein PsorP6_017261 [Peronosclerospora sorghi]|uniref:Uncharacterized protein n=1 Tax=Peronosclerospora sorghi TaxID=230839 RepID=A0ACC0WKJ6_9STRA|nr:hypothetical protein PsorP6_017261 [Peronosclerospora sorghi]